MDAFVDALLPEFSRLTEDALAEVAYELSADRGIQGRGGAPARPAAETRSKLRFIRDWLRDNAPPSEVDDRVAGLEGQERSLRNLQVSAACCWIGPSVQARDAGEHGPLPRCAPRATRAGGDGGRAGRRARRGGGGGGG
ncbi:MAG: hypothetical protein R3F60_20480 [bacterium]